VQPGSRSDALVCLTDIMATVAELTGASLPQSAAVDSVSFMPVILGNSEGSRTSVINHSISGKFAIRDKAWKLLLTPGSGGWGSPKDAQAKSDGLPDVQLYRLDKDLGETKNLAGEHPEQVEKMRAMLKDQVERGRSTPGKPQRNDVPVDIDKSGKK
jgi:arylsulfatase A-like enzyme